MEGEKAGKVAKTSEETADDSANDELFDVDIGIVHRAEALSLGISLADAMRHTRAQLNAVVRRAFEHRVDAGDVGLISLRYGDEKSDLAHFKDRADAVQHLSDTLVGARPASPISRGRSSTLKMRAMWRRSPSPTLRHIQAIRRTGC